MSNLVAHAKLELRRAGLFDADSDYGGMLAEGVMKIVKVFAEEGHSGMSAAMTVQLLEKLLRFKPLTPITSDPSEWMDVTEHGPQGPMWQNRRSSSCFSTDGGKTYYDIDAGDDRAIRTADAPRIGEV